MNPFLSSERLHLYQLTPDAAERYYTRLNDQTTTKWMQQGIYPMTLERCREYIQNVNGLHLAIVRKGEEKESVKQGITKMTDTLKSIFSMPDDVQDIIEESKKYCDCHIGNITLSNIHGTFRTAEISIILWDERGKGYGTEAIKTLVSHAFNRMNLNRIQAGAVVDNIGCIKAFEKAGFTREGVLREAYYCEGSYRDTVIMGILKREWGAVK